MTDPVTDLLAAYTIGVMVFYVASGWMLEIVLTHEPERAQGWTKRSIFVGKAIVAAIWPILLSIIVIALVYHSVRGGDA